MELYDNDSSGSGGSSTSITPNSREDADNLAIPMNVRTIISDKNRGLSLNDADKTEYIDEGPGSEDENEKCSLNSYGNMNEQMSILKVKKVKHYKLKRFKAHLDYCKNTRNITLLKYHDLAFVINIIQISVIVVSTSITFFETIREQLEIQENNQKLVSVCLSTYIALIVAISRFLKFDELKEQFSKLSEKWNQTINKMRIMQYDVESLDSYDFTPPEMKKAIYDILNPKYREDISIVDNETDNLINMKEKTYYKNILMNMRLDDQILDRHDTLFLIYKRLQNLTGFDSSLDKYRTNHLPCIPWECYMSRYDTFFTDMENVCSAKTYDSVLSKKSVTLHQEDQQDMLRSKNNNDVKSRRGQKKEDNDYNESDDDIEYSNVEECVKETFYSKSKYNIV